jgi:protein involved in polysaccharide export with SLBB domain
VGENVIIEFVDPRRNGEYRMTMDPNEKDADAPPAAAQRFYVQGEVAHPGAFRLLMPTRVLGALVAAGGFKDSAGRRQIIIMHVTGESVPFNYEEVVQGRNSEQNIFLQSGDIIIVK